MPVAAAARAAATSPSGCAIVRTPTGARKNGDGERVPSTSTERSPDGVAGEHARPEPPPLERLDIRAHGRLAAGAAGDVGEGPGVDLRLRGGLPVLRPDRPLGGARDVDRVLDETALEGVHRADHLTDGHVPVPGTERCPGIRVLAARAGTFRVRTRPGAWHQDVSPQPPRRRVSSLRGGPRALGDAARRVVCGGARRSRHNRPPARHVLAEGLHPADEALPRRLPLLHVRGAAEARRARVPDARRGAGDRPRRRGAGCREALFTLGDKPELRYRAAREELASLGCATTLEYLAHAAEAVLDETGLLPHLNPGVLTRDDVRALRPLLDLDGSDAGDDVGAALAPRRPALRLARQAPGRAARHHRRRRRGARPVHDGDPDRDRRDAGGAARRAARDRRCARAPRPHPGGDRPELPREAGHEDGGRAGAAARRPPLDACRRPADPAGRRSISRRRRT